MDGGKEIVEVSPDVHKEGVNANRDLIVEDDGSLTLIDTGMSSDGKKILNYVRANLSKQPSDVNTIVLTHCHIDHARGVYAIKKAVGARHA